MQQYPSILSFGVPLTICSMLDLFLLSDRCSLVRIRSIIDTSVVCIPVLRAASSFGDIRVHSDYYVLAPSSFRPASPPLSLYNALINTSLNRLSWSLCGQKKSVSVSWLSEAVSILDIPSSDLTREKQQQRIKFWDISRMLPKRIYLYSETVKWVKFVPI